MQSGVMPSFALDEQRATVVDLAVVDAALKSRGDMMQIHSEVRQS